MVGKRQNGPIIALIGPKMSKHTRKWTFKAKMLKNGKRGKKVGKRQNGPKIAQIWPKRSKYTRKWTF